MYIYMWEPDHRPFKAAQDVDLKEEDDDDEDEADHRSSVNAAAHCYGDRVSGLGFRGSDCEGHHDAGSDCPGVALGLLVNGSDQSFVAVCQGRQDKLLPGQDRLKRSPLHTDVRPHTLNPRL